MNSLLLKQISSLSIMMSLSLRYGDIGNLSERNVAYWNPIGSPPASLMMIMLMVMSNEVMRKRMMMD